MKGEKDNALEKADQLEQRVSEQKAVNEKVGSSSLNLAASNTIAIGSSLGTLPLVRCSTPTTSIFFALSHFFQLSISSLAKLGQQMVE